MPIKNPVRFVIGGGLTLFCQMTEISKPQLPGFEIPEECMTAHPDRGVVRRAAADLASCDGSTGAFCSLGIR